MTSRERVQLAMNHQEPDRVPIWFGGAATGAVEKTYEDMGNYMGIQFWKQWTSFFDTFKFDERMLQRLNTDVRHVTLGAAGAKNWYPSKIYPDGTYTNIYNMRFRKAGYFSSAIVENPMRNLNTVEDIKSYDEWPDSKAVAVAACEGLEEEARDLRQNTEFAIVGDILWSHIELAQWLRGLDEWVIDIAKRQDVLEAVFQKLWDYQTPIYDAYLKAVAKYLDVVFIGDDLGMQDRLMVKHSDFVTYIKPWLKKRVDFIKERTDNLPVILHSCGSIYKAIPDLIDIGLDGLNPLQPFAKNMEPERLKSEFGDRLFFLGGLDHQHILPKTIDEVKNFVERLIKAYAPGGGFIIAPTHDIPPVPVENIFGAFDHVMEIGTYPIQSN